MREERDFSPSSRTQESVNEADQTKQRSFSTSASFIHSRNSLPQDGLSCDFLKERRQIHVGEIGLRVTSRSSFIRLRSEAVCRFLNISLKED